ncbi:hypothetical protein CAPTEDRAFT_20619 [Capitella teleta]|uniref:Proton-coupled zinc antiporter SLC30A5 n=1 Tax=Capitella teleta TaxID=283909 RepID=R7TS70_CAPTE|nr:hypothetical protein CAPTEDRAFT_20619 [Capitella teleta]|eukprot:ELT96504.1 hypothetical protein CAPTEDRAFT_20619 [Capitella teleta]
MHSRAIYPSKLLPYIGALVVAKFGHAFSTFLSYDILKVLHLVQFLFLIKAGSALCLLVLQKPFSNGRSLSKHQWFRIFRHAFFGCVLTLLWQFGLTLCGPFRTLLLFEHSDTVIIAGATALFTHNGTPSKTRGAVFFLFAVIGILLFDHDLHDHAQTHNAGTHGHSNILTHIFDHMTDLTGLSDHKGGVALLFCTLCAQVAYSVASKKLSVDVGGAKRLHALSSLASTLILSPWAVAVYMTRETLVQSWTATVLPLTLVVFFLVLDFYVDAVCCHQMDPPLANRLGSSAIFLSGLFLTFFWSHPFIAQITNAAVITNDHILSGGVIFSFVLFLFATQILTSSSRSSAKGSFIGYSASGLPLYNFAGDALQRTSQSVYTVARNGLRQILEESDSRRIFYFLCVNLGFTFVELTYGATTNSLGLISDGFHMLFDCSALVMGLYASVMSRWKATRIYSYGYDRVEIVSGFVNGLFLMVIACFVFMAAVNRIVDPPEVSTEKLLVVSVAGLLVNLVGIFAFHHGHSHGGGGGSHGHSHGGHGHSHGHAHESQDSMTHNTNMEGVFLHVLADTMGSVGVIVSTLLIEYMDLKVADPICSLFIATLIFISVLPLVKETVQILLLRTPKELQDNLNSGLRKLLSVEGVISYREDHFWRHSSKVICGTLHVQIKADASEQKIVSQTNSILKESGVNNLTIQVEKESFFQHISGLGLSSNQLYEITKDFKSLSYENTANFINAI